MTPSELPGLRRRAAPEPEASGRGMPALRLLPVVIVATVFMLGLRIEIVVETIANARRASLQVVTPPAQAQTTPPKPGAAPAAAGAKPEEKADGAEEKPEGEPGAASGTTFNASSLTKSEIDTLQRLSERRGQIEKREQDVAAREGLMKAGESRIDGKIAQLQELEKTIQALLGKYDKQKQAEIEQLVKIYGTMKPRDAAQIFDTLDMPILVAVVQTMPTAKAAERMALMNREKARLLTEELSTKKQLSAGGG